MKRGFVVAAVIAIAATVAGCSHEAVIPAFLLPKATGTASAGTVSAPPTEAAQSPSAAPAASAAVSAMPTATISATPTPTPSPSPAATATAATEPYKVLAMYHSTMPSGLPVALKYSRYSTPLDYFVALRSGKVRAKPEAKASIALSFSLGTRYRVDKLVQGTDGKSKWYHVYWSDKRGSHAGYVIASAGSARSFRIGMMLDRANQLKENTDTPNTVYIVNYKNVHGIAPALPNGKQDDVRGNRRSMSAPAYTQPSSKAPFVYAPDGLLGTKIKTTGNFTQVYFPSFGESRWVPSKYLSKSKDSITKLDQLVIVDRQNQNSGTFEYANGSWRLIALTFVSTGKSGGFYTKTPLGDFMAQQKVSRFYYYYDGTQKIEGYAPWAVRFSGGGYLHGVPRKSKYDAKGERTDLQPGESLRTLGTTPQSHMCVRNYTSYAKFIYDWYKKGEFAVIVFE